jgi:hypothetical protein
VRLLLLVVLMCAAVPSVQAQAVASAHVIPQVADSGNYVMLFFINRATSVSLPISAIVGGLP